MGKHSFLESPVLKPRHVTPQIDCLGKMSTVLRFQHTFMVFLKDIGGKTFIFN